MDKRDEELYSSEDEESVCETDQSDNVEVDDLNPSEKKNQFTINNILGLDERGHNGSQISPEPIKPIAISPASICGTCKLTRFNCYQYFINSLSEESFACFSHT